MEIRLLTSSDRTLLSDFISKTHTLYASHPPVDWLLDGLDANDNSNFAISAILDGDQILSILVGCTFNWIFKTDKKYSAWFIAWTCTLEKHPQSQQHRNTMTDVLVYHFEHHGYRSFYFSVSMPTDCAEEKRKKIIKRQNNIKNYALEIIDTCYSARDDSPLMFILTRNIINFPIAICKLTKDNVNSHI